MARRLSPPQDVTHNRGEFSSGSQSPAAANPARHCLARKQGYAANRTSGVTPARRACVGTAAASAPDRSVLPTRCGADVSAFLSPGAALAGQAGELSRGPGNGPASMCRDIRKQKRCWAPAVGSRRKRTAGRGLGAQRRLLCEQPTSVLLCNPGWREPHASLARVYQSGVVSPQHISKRRNGRWLRRGVPWCSPCPSTQAAIHSGLKSALEKFKFPTGHTLTLTRLLRLCF